MLFFNDFVKVLSTFRCIVGDWKKTYFIARYLLVIASVKFLEQVYPNELIGFVWFFFWLYFYAYFFRCCNRVWKEKVIWRNLKQPAKWNKSSKRTTFHEDLTDLQKAQLNAIKQCIWEKAARFYGNYYQTTARARILWKRERCYSATNKYVNITTVKNIL